MKTHYKSPHQTKAVEYGVNSLPTDRPVAAYYRQSTGAQVGNISTLIQTVDLKAYLRQKGWAKELIILIDNDQGVSGQKKIDERKGMSLMFEMIITGKVGAVACQDEDRLFRDQTQIQVNIFIEACKTHRVLVLTPFMVYDFAHPTMGSFFIRQFRAKCEMAADYTNSIVNGRMFAARERVQLEGKWCGGSIPVGYMVDCRRTLADGSANPTYRKYVVFEPYAEVVRAYYRIFWEVGCVARTAIKVIGEQGPWFPQCPAPDGFKINYRLAHYYKMRCPSRRGLVQMLTNAAYLGHWVVRGVVTIENNHQPMVDEQTFMRVFNYISEVNLDGTPNRQHVPVRAAAKPRREGDRPVEPPLCWGMVVSPASETHYVGLSWHKTTKAYNFVCTDNSTREERFVWAKNGAQVDEEVTAMLRAKLTATFQDQTWQDIVDKQIEKRDAECRVRESQIKAVDTTIENLITSLSQLTTPELIKAIEAKYAAAKIERQRLVDSLAAYQQEAAHIELLHKLRSDYQSAVADWDGLKRDERRAIMLAFIKQVELVQCGRNTMQLTVRWRDNTADSTLLRKRGGKADGWLASEIELLKEFVRNKTPQVEVAAAFPTRSWKAIVHTVRRVMGVYYAVGRKTIRDHENYLDYLERTNSPVCIASNTQSRSPCR